MNGIPTGGREQALFRSLIATVWWSRLWRTASRPRQAYNGCTAVNERCASTAQAITSRKSRRGLLREELRTPRCPVDTRRVHAEALTTCAKEYWS